jgi:hypothetical protein
LQQNRDDVLRYGESIGCDLLKAAVRQQEAQSQSSVDSKPMVASGAYVSSSPCSLYRPRPNPRDIADDRREVCE